MIADEKIVVLKDQVECLRQALREICAAFEEHDDCYYVCTLNEHAYANDMYQIAIAALEAGL
jgi:hypothetical protein